MSPLEFRSKWTFVPTLKKNLKILLRFVDPCWICDHQNVISLSLGPNLALCSQSTFKIFLRCHVVILIYCYFCYCVKGDQQNENFTVQCKLLCFFLYYAVKVNVLNLGSWMDNLKTWGPYSVQTRATHVCYYSTLYPCPSISQPIRRTRFAFSWNCSIPLSE